MSHGGSRSRKARIVSLFAVILMALSGSAVHAGTRASVGPEKDPFYYDMIGNSARVTLRALDSYGGSVRGMAKRVKKIPVKKIHAALATRLSAFGMKSHPPALIEKSPASWKTAGAFYTDDVETAFFEDELLR